VAARPRGERKSTVAGRGASSSTIRHTSANERAAPVKDEEGVRRRRREGRRRASPNRPRLARDEQADRTSTRTTALTVPRAFEGAMAVAACVLNQPSQAGIRARLWLLVLAQRRVCREDWRLLVLLCDSLAIGCSFSSYPLAPSTVIASEFRLSSSASAIAGGGITVRRSGTISRVRGRRAGSWP
jgi:hypothetical protein